ncbi:MAG: hypothetical protein ABI553_05200 [Chloroflexota bacterium]
MNEGTPAAGRVFANNPETGDWVLNAQGTARQGQVTFTGLPNAMGKSSDPAPRATTGAATLSGSIAWMCGPARDVPTAVDGSWFK